MFRLFVLAVVLSAAQATAWAAGAGDPQRYRLTPALLDRMEAVQEESKAAGQSKAQEDVDAQSPAELARELDADPRIRVLLAKHRLTSTEYATAAFALIHAGMFIATESATDKKSLAAAMASFTPEQRANIELLRKRTK